MCVNYGDQGWQLKCTSILTWLIRSEHASSLAISYDSDGV